MARPQQFPEVSTLRQSAAPPAPTFQALYRQELGYVWASLKRLGAASSELEDLTHEVFAIALRRQADFDPARPVRPWLFGIAFRVLTGERRRQRPVLVDDLPDQSTDATALSQLLSREEAALVWSAIGSLSPERRAVFVMQAVDGHPVPEIAAALELPLNTAYSRLRLAREDLAAALKRLRAQRGEP